MPKRTRNESPQKQAMREMMKDYLKNNDVKVKDGADVKRWYFQDYFQGTSVSYCRKMRKKRYRFINTKKRCRWGLICSQTCIHTELFVLRIFQ